MFQHYSGHSYTLQVRQEENYMVKLSLGGQEKLKAEFYDESGMREYRKHLFEKYLIP